jgi:putative ABC transport system permease protein
MDGIAKRLAEEYPDTNSGQIVHVDPLQGFHAQDMRPSLLLLFASVGLVLFIACSNAAHLLLARASSRSQEIAIRTTLGAGRNRVVRQLLVESLVQSLLGGCLGLLFAVWGVDLISLLIPDSAPPIYHQINVDFVAVGFTFLVALTTGIVFGLVPALSASTPDLTESLKEGGRSPSGQLKGGTARRALIVSEMALAVVLLVGAVLTMRSYIAVMFETPGFNPQNTLTATIGLPESKYPEPRQHVAFYRSLEQRLKKVPGIRAVGLTDPLLWGSDYGFSIEGRLAPERGSHPVTDGLVVSPDYFATMEIPLIRGRLFAEYDGENAPRVAVIDRRFADIHWPGADPIGKRVKLSLNPDSTRPWLEVIGVVGHVKNKGVDDTSRETIYRPYFQEPESYMTVVVRADVPPETLTAIIRSEVAKIDPDQPIFRIRTLEQYLAETMVPRRVSSATMIGFAWVALIMAAVGLYGLMAFSVSQRTREIGLRMALGAKANDIVRMVFGEVGRLTLLGIALGSFAAFLITPFMTSLLFGVSPRDPWTFLGIIALLGTVALVSALLPARRAARVEPLVALRYE